MKNTKLISAKNFTPSLKQALIEDNNFKEEYWGIIGQILTDDGISVGTSHYIQELEIGQPYKFEIVRIVDSGRLVDRSSRGSFVILICKAILHVKKDQLEQVKNQNIKRESEYRGNLSLLEKKD